MKNFMPDPLFQRSRILYAMQNTERNKKKRKEHRCFLFMVVFFFVLLFAGSLFPITKKELGNVVSDSDLAYKEMSDAQVMRFLKQFPRNRMTEAQASFINSTCRKENVGVIWAFSRVQNEQGLVVNFENFKYEWKIERLFSYGLDIYDKTTGTYPYVGFSNQVTAAVHRMREFADEWRSGTAAYVEGWGDVVCANAATYSLHRYNCVWGAASNWGVYNIGNELFVIILRDFQKRWLSITEAKSRLLGGFS